MTGNRMVDAVRSTDEKSKRWKATFAASRMAYQTGEFRQAESLLARALELASDIPDRSFAISATQVGIGAVLLAESRIREALSQFRKAVTGLEGHGDDEHKELLAVALRFYAQTLSESGDERGAEKELLRSIDILRGLGADGRVQMAYSLADLSGLYLSVGRRSEAEKYIGEAMKIAAFFLEPGSAEYTRVDMIYQISKPMPEEERHDMAQDGIRRLQYAYGAKHPNIAWALERYFKVLTESGNTAKLEEAKEMFGITDKAGK
ncbi:MAG: hypothetical protein K2Y22_17250 [Candidatus Obscuribacterales bacterium]|nr:hypothetical protein [Candidatus Obscuribacterales bacterium]